MEQRDWTAADGTLYKLVLAPARGSTLGPSRDRRRTLSFVNQFDSTARDMVRLVPEDFYLQAATDDELADLLRKGR